MPSATTWSAARRARTTCSRRCCWRAGPRPTTATRAKSPSTSRRCSNPWTRSSIAATVMRTLLGDPLYRRHLEARGRTQCAALGYSDANKEGGICASRFAMFPRAGGTVRGAVGRQRALRHFPCARRQHRARWRAHRFAGAHRAGGHDQRRVAPDRAGRGHQPGLRPAAHRHAHAGARLSCADPAASVARRSGMMPRRNSCSSPRGSPR